MNQSTAAKRILRQPAPTPANPSGTALPTPPPAPSAPAWKSTGSRHTFCCGVLDYAFSNNALCYAETFIVKNVGTWCKTVGKAKPGGKEGDWSEAKAAGRGALRTDCLAVRDGGRVARRVRHLADEDVTRGRPGTAKRFEVRPRIGRTTARGASHSCSASGGGPIGESGASSFTPS
jgi:hypothetical protein